MGQNRQLEGYSGIFGIIGYNKSGTKMVLGKLSHSRQKKIKLGSHLPTGMKVFSRCKNNCERKT